MADISYLAGLDLGQASDFTALAILEQGQGTTYNRGYAASIVERFQF